MKKLAAVIITGLLIGSAAFAKPDFDGDVQAHIGVAFDEFKIKNNGVNTIANTALFNIDAQSWNFFEINSLISVGFMVGTDFGWGGLNSLKVAGNKLDKDYYKNAFHWNFQAAPAVAFNFKPVRLQCSLGLDVSLVPGFGLDTNLTKTYTSYPCAFGMVTEVQAKFFYKQQFSPVVGYRFAVAGSGKIVDKDKNSKTELKHKVDSASFKSNVFYAGASFNW